MNCEKVFEGIEVNFLENLTALLIRIPSAISLEQYLKISFSWKFLPKFLWEYRRQILN